MTSSNTKAADPRGPAYPGAGRSVPQKDDKARLENFDAEAVRAAAPWGIAIQALEQALLTDVDPELDDPRLFSRAPGGEFLLMPSAAQTYSGVKALTVAPGNPARGLEKIQGIYVLFDSDTLAPLATLDGTEITAIRTPATSLLAIKHISQAAPTGHRFPEAPKILVFGTGVQALNHIRASHYVFSQATFTVAGRRPERLEALRTALAAEDIHIAPSGPNDVSVADIIICATTSAQPLFDGNEPAPNAIIAAVGAHGLGVREVDTTLVLRSDVVVEGRAAAWREAGDLIPARSVEEWQQIRPLNLRELVRGELTRTPGRPCLFNGVGMSWQDLVTAAVVYEGRTSQ
jgi:1-piperideine-2-carboxylate/1-pyrroline-2-carboxylate reductase [NAD(P)H]